MRNKILVINESNAVYDAVASAVDPNKFEVLSAHTAEAGLEAAKKIPSVIIISDRFNIGSFIDSIRNESPESYIILSVNNYIQYLDAASVNANIQNYLLEPVDPNMLTDTLQLAVDSLDSGVIPRTGSNLSDIYADLSAGLIIEQSRDLQMNYETPTDVEPEKLNIESSQDFTFDINENEDIYGAPTSPSGMAVEGFTSGEKEPSFDVDASIENGSLYETNFTAGDSPEYEIQPAFGFPEFETVVSPEPPQADDIKGVDEYPSFNAIELSGEEIIPEDFNQQVASGQPAKEPELMPVDIEYELPAPEPHESIEYTAKPELGETAHFAQTEPTDAGHSGINNFENALPAEPDRKEPDTPAQTTSGGIDMDAAFEPGKELEFPVPSEKPAEDEVTPDSVLFHGNDDYIASVPVQAKYEKDYVTIPEAEELFGLKHEDTPYDKEILSKLRRDEKLSSSEEDELLSELYSLLATDDAKQDDKTVDLSIPDSLYELPSAPPYDPGKGVLDDAFLNGSQADGEKESALDQFLREAEAESNKEGAGKEQDTPNDDILGYFGDKSSKAAESDNILSYFGDREDETDESFLTSLSQSAMHQENEEREVLSALFGEMELDYNSVKSEAKKQEQPGKKELLDKHETIKPPVEKTAAGKTVEKMQDKKEKMPLFSAAHNEKEPAQIQEKALFEEPENDFVEQKHDSVRTGFKKMADILLPKTSDTKQTHAKRGGWLSIDLTKDEINELLSKSISKSELHDIVKDVVRESIGSSVERLVPKIAEQIVREELALLKSGK